MGNCGSDRPGGKMRDTYGTNKGQRKTKEGYAETVAQRGN